MAYNANALVRLAALKALAEKTKAEIDNINTDVSKAIKSLGVSGNTVSFYTSADKSGTAAFTFDFPKELFLDQAKTTFVQKFAFSTETYPSATDPKLEGKPVMVLAVKGQNPDSCTYSFLDMSALVDTYKAKATGKDASTTITVSGYEIEVKVNVSAAAGNALSLKADKVKNATDGNLAALDASGNLTDSGKKPADFVAAETGKRLMTDAEGEKLKGISAGATKTAASETNGHITIDGVDTTVYTEPSDMIHGTVASDSDVTAMLTEVFGA